ncbi:hypothetical protein D3C73_657660 [compost metagenome]
MVILISDGYSDVNLDQALAPYKSKQIAVNTVGMNKSDRDGNDLLQRIATQTGGTFYSVSDMGQLSSIFSKIYIANQNWHLVGERPLSTIDSSYYMLVRIICILLIGVLIGLSLGIVFDNRFLARSFAIGGAAAGLIAGIILELGFKHVNGMEITIFDTVVTLSSRLAADLVLALVLSLSTAVIAYKQGSAVDPKNGLYNRGGRSAQASDNQRGSHKDFRN